LEGEKRSGATPRRGLELRRTAASSFLEEDEDLQTLVSDILVVV
jgi:hypothetical protein